jgi:hypothetical protein
MSWRIPFYERNVQVLTELNIMKTHMSFLISRGENHQRIVNSRGNAKHGLPKVYTRINGLPGRTCRGKGYRWNGKGAK